MAYRTSTSSNDSLRIGAHTSHDFPSSVHNSFTRQHSFVTVVVAQAQSVICKAPSHVAGVVGRNEHFVLLDSQQSSLVLDDLTYWSFDF